MNAWDSVLSPIALYPLFAGVASAGVVALRRFANAQLAVRLGSFTWEQIHVLLGLLALLITVGYFFRDHSGVELRPRVLAAARRLDRTLRRRADAVARALPAPRLHVAQSFATTPVMRSPASVGFSPTSTPASRSASILAAAVPLPPLTIAPAWPIFLPGGAVTPGDVGDDRLAHRRS